MKIGHEGGLPREWVDGNADAVEWNMRVLHRQMTRAGLLTGNLIVQGDGAAPFWGGDGAVTVGGDRNVYLTATGASARFVGGSWEEWQAAGRDRRGRVALAGLLDIASLVPAMVQSPAVRAVGVDPAIWAAVAVEAGPRFRGTLSQTIDLLSLVLVRGGGVVKLLLAIAADEPGPRIGR